jgi:hypothetical protein
MARFLNRLRLPTFAGDPSSPADGEIWYNSALNTFRMKPNSSFPMPVAAGTRFADYATGRWYPLQVGAPNTANATASRAFTNPFVLSKQATLSGISYEVSTAWTTAGNVRLGLYNDDGGRMPTNLIQDYGTVAATLGIKVVSATNVLSPGMYWIVAVNQGGSGGTTGQFRAVTGIHDFIGDSSATPSSNFFNGSLNCYYSDTGFTGALPSSFGAVAGIALGPRFLIRFSA